MGFTIGGGPTRPVVNTPEAPYQPKAVHPNPQKEKQRQAFYAALDKKIEGIRELLALATEPGETMFWQRELDRLKGL